MIKNLISSILLFLSCITTATDTLPDIYVKALRGDGEAAGVMAESFRQGKGVRRDSQLAIKWYKQSAESGFAPAMNWLALMYMSGEMNQDIDYVAANDLLERAARAGNASAMHNLARTYHYGLGRKIDVEKAISLYRKALKSGSDVSAYELAKVLLWRNNISERKMAAELLIQTAEENADAAELLGKLYQDGIGVTKSLTSAADMYLLSASKGNTKARLDYYFLVRDTKMPESEIGLGERLLMEAASENDLVALEEAAILLMSKKTPPVSLASEYFARAAMQGSASAQFYLGVHYYNGIGVKKDIDAALLLINSAAKSGSHDAILWLKENHVNMAK
jgi:uncharacterized protein